jgi:hypothetical protein
MNLHNSASVEEYVLPLKAAANGKLSAQSSGDGLMRKSAMVISADG